MAWKEKWAMRSATSATASAHAMLMTTPAAASSSIPRRFIAASEEGVDEGGNSCCLANEQQHGHDQQRDDKRRNPPELSCPEKPEQLPDGLHPADDIPGGFHEALSPGLKTMVRSRTSASIPLRWKVLSASAGVLTIGSLRRLKLLV